MELRQFTDRYAPLATLSGIWFLVQFSRFLFPPLFPKFQHIFGVSNTETGLLFSALIVVYALMQFPSGVLSDKFDRALIISVGMMVFAAASILVSVAPSFSVIVAAVVLIGIGTGTYKTVAINILSVIYPERKGRALGVMDTVGQMGGVAAPAAIYALTFWLNWRAAFVLTAILVLALTAVHHQQIGARLSKTDTDSASPDDRMPTNPAPAGDGQSYLSAFRSGRFLLFASVCTCRAIAWQGLSAFLPLYLIHQKGISPNLATLIYTGLFVTTFVQLGTGFLSDKFGQLSVTDGIFLVSVAGMGGLLFLEDKFTIIGSVLLLSGGMHGFRPVRGSYLVASIPDEVSGGTLGLVRTIMASVGATSPVVLGIVSDRFGYQAAFEIIGGVLVLALFLALAVTALERWSNDH